MCNGNLKYWFLVDHGDDRVVLNIIPGHSEDEVAANFEHVVGKARIRRLTWSRLSELTGCKIPSVCNRADYAAGGLMFEHRHKFITLWMSK